MSLYDMAQSAVDRDSAAAFAVRFPSPHAAQPWETVRAAYGMSRLEFGRKVDLAYRWRMVSVETRGTMEWIALTDRGRETLQRHAEREAKRAAKEQRKVDRPRLLPRLRRRGGPGGPADGL